MTVADFVGRFHQPIGDLPLDCDAAERSLPQARIAIEVLRSYVGARPLMGMGCEQALIVGEPKYRLAEIPAPTSR